VGPDAATSGASSGAESSFRGSPDRRRVTRSSDAGPFLETFLVAAVIAAIAVRSYLVLTGYPRVGSGEFHIAHVLWGGLLMVVAVLAFIVFLDRPIAHVATGIAGVGFGIFIDEVGKFVTSDNDYFFRPAIAIIYVTFVGLFLVLRAVLSAPMLSPRESLANAMDLLEGGLDGTLTDSSRAQVIALLAKAADGPLRDALATQTARVDAGRPLLPWLANVDLAVDRAYTRALANRWFEWAVVGAMGLYAAASAVAVVILIAVQGTAQSAAGIAQALATFAGSALVIRGLPDLWHSRAAAYRWFQRGILVWILVAQPFVFYTAQLGGLAGLVLAATAYSVVRYLSVRETVLASAKAR
jgi:hypothetical protein